MRSVVLLIPILLMSCIDEETAQEFDKRLLEVYKSRSEQLDPAYAIIKSGVGGDAWLGTVHGFPNNHSVCMELIEPYQKDPSLSVLPGDYTCRVLYDAPGAWTTP